MATECYPINWLIPLRSGIDANGGSRTIFLYDSLEDRPIRFRATPEASLLLDPGGDLAYISLGFQASGEDEIEESNAGAAVGEGGSLPSAGG